MFRPTGCFNAQDNCQKIIVITVAMTKMATKGIRPAPDIVTHAELQPEQ